MFFTVQLLLALMALFAIAIGLSIAGSALRLGVDLCRRKAHLTQWRFLSWEGLIVGTVVIGLWLCRPTRDVYLSPTGSERLEVRRLSLLELPFGMHLYSDMFQLVNVDYIDADGHRHRQRGRESYPESNTTRVMGRTIYWGSVGPTRVVVCLPDSGLCLFFPEPISNGYGASDGVIEAYLRGDPVAAVQAMMD